MGAAPPRGQKTEDAWLSSGQASLYFRLYLGVCQAGDAEPLVARLLTAHQLDLRALEAQPFGEELPAGGIRRPLDRWRREPDVEDALLPTRHLVAGSAGLNANTEVGHGCRR